MLLARSIYADYCSSTDKQEFFNHYKEFLKATGKNTLEDIALKMNFDITKKEFWKKAIKTVIDEIELFMSLTKW